MSANNTTAHGNTGALIHRARPGIEPASSWILVGFISAVPQQELPIWAFFLKNRFYWSIDNLQCRVIFRCIAK